jgi:hypothetical protein
MAKISIPFNLDNQNEEKQIKLKEKEIKAKEHLEEMAEITRNLSYNDIKLLQKDSGGKNKKIDDKKIAEEQREKQE